MKWMALPILFVLFFSVTAQCSIMELQAVSRAPMEWSDFNITFNDYDGDNILQLNEITYFSGVMYMPFAQFFYQVKQVPGGSWIFDDNNYIGPVIVSKDTWDYTQTSAVPISSSILLLGSGLTGFWFIGRRFCS